MSAILAVAVKTLSIQLRQITLTMVVKILTLQVRQRRKQVKKEQLKILRLQLLKTAKSHKWGEHAVAILTAIVLAGAATLAALRNFLMSKKLINNK